MGLAGDDRTLFVYSVSPVDGGKRLVGSAWQLDDGTLVGEGIFQILLREDMPKTMYYAIASHIDDSPLSALRARITSSPFLIARFEEGRSNASGK